MRMMRLAGIGLAWGLVFALSPADFSRLQAHADSHTPACGPLVSGVHQVSTVAQLQSVGTGDSSECGLGADYEMHADIDLSDSPNWVPIGSERGIDGFRFQGTFDGRGHEIRGLSVSNFSTTSVSSGQGLFASVASTGVIRNVHLVDVTLRGSNLYYVGGLVGINRGKVETSSVSGTIEVSDSIAVGGLIGTSNGSAASIHDSFANTSTSASGSSWHTGGLVGSLETGADLYRSYALGDTSGVQQVGGLVGSITVDGSNIGNSYARGDVTGSTLVGGLVGWNSGATINASYSTGAVSATLAGAAVGGLVGDIATASVVSNSFYDASLANQGDDSGRGTPKTTAEMTTFATFSDTNTAGLDVAWRITDGWQSFDPAASPPRVWGIRVDLNDGYPFLLWQYDAEPPRCGPLVDGVHQVSTAFHLANIGSGGANSPCGLADSYTLVTNLDLTAGPEWTPIGSAAAPFTGDFDGGDFTITGLKLDSRNITLTDQGLFGAMGAGGSIENVNLVGVVLDTEAERNNLGALVGLITGGTVTDVSVSGTIDLSVTNGSINSKRVGGLVGRMTGGEVRSSSAQVNVTAWDRLGGLIGEVSNATISESHSSGAVVGGAYTGGLIGSILNSTTVNNSSSTGSVRGDVFVGGLVGYIFNSTTVSASFATGDVNGFNTVGGFVGYARGDTTLANSYATGDVEGRSGFNTGGFLGWGDWNNQNGVVIGSVTVEKTFSTGRVVVQTTSSSDPPPVPGGLIGAHRDPTALEVNNSFWDVQSSAVSSSVGGTGKNTAQMTSVDTYSDIQTVGLAEAWGIVSGFATPDANASPARLWGICSGVNGGYPYLLWQFSGNPCPAPAVTANPDRAASMDKRASAPGLHVDFSIAVGEPILGAPIVVGGEGLAGGSAFSLVVRSTPQVLAQGSANDAGNFSLRATMPALPAGAHTLTLTAVALDGSILSLVQRFTVDDRGVVTSVSAPTSGQQGALAATGLPLSALWWGGGLSMVLFLAGVAALLASRYRNRSIVG